MKHDEYTGWRKSSHSNSSGGCVEVAFAGWHKSSHSNSSDGCVEVATTDRAVGVRDSKQHGSGPVLEFAAAEWKLFVAGIKNGEFDL